MVSTFRSIRWVDAEQWDAVTTPGHPYHSWHFLLAVETSKPENAEFWYLVFTDDAGKYRATAVLSAFYMSLSVLADDDPTIRRLEKIWPNMFRFKMLMCGIPVSAGQHNFAHDFEIDAAEIHEAVVQKMAEIAKEQRIKLLSIKELGRKDLHGTDVYLSNGFAMAQSPSSQTVRVRWDSFAEYLHEMKHTHRRQIVGDLHKMGVNLPQIIPATKYDPTDEQPRWVIGNKKLCAPKDFHTMYLEVLSHTKTKLETLEVPFFEELYKVPGLEVLCIMHRGVVISAALIFQHGNTLVWMFVGKFGDKDATYRAYFNTIHGIIELAIQRGCKSISLGQTTDIPKMRRGSTPEQRYFFIKATNKYLNKLLMRFQSKLFPNPVLPVISPFHSPKPVSGKAEQHIK